MVIFTKGTQIQRHIKNFVFNVSIVLGLLMSNYAIANDALSNTNAVLKHQPTSTQALNINQANLQQLMAIKGLGKVKAQAILDYIKAHGELVSLDELIEVKGIGVKLVAQVKDKLTI